MAICTKLHVTFFFFSFSIFLHLNIFQSWHHKHKKKKRSQHRQSLSVSFTRKLIYIYIDIIRQNYQTNAWYRNLSPPGATSFLSGPGPSTTPPNKSKTNTQRDQHLKIPCARTFWSSRWISPKFRQERSLKNHWYPSEIRKCWVLLSISKAIDRVPISIVSSWGVGKSLSVST